MNVIIRRRDFTGTPIIHNLELSVERYDWDVRGGPKTAVISASGERDALFGLVNLMRCPVEIIADSVEKVWWGYLAVLDIGWDALQYGVDVDAMSNNVAVAYTNENMRYTTDWSADADSVSEYGTKEILLSRSDATEADALQQRDTHLASAKYPIPILTMGDGDRRGAKITCRGWYDTFEWLYYENLTGYEGYIVTGEGGREVGEDDRPILAMSFEILADEAWDATTLFLRIWRQGDNVPTDNLNISIRADNGGTPDTSALATSSITGSDVPTSAEWIEFSLSAAVTLQPDTTYWIYAARSGAIDADAYYMLDTNLNNGYPRGSLIYYNTTLSTWQDASHKGDLLFQLYGELETSDQISGLVASEGQFFEGAIIENDSGVDTVQYRNGDSTALYELENLLRIGTVNDRRLLAETTPNFYLRVYEEPAKPATMSCYRLDADGKLYFAAGPEVPAELCPVGIWCRLVDVIPPTIDLSMVADPSIFFIDAAEYDVVNKKYRILRTREQGNSLDIGGVVQG